MSFLSNRIVIVTFFLAIAVSQIKSQTPAFPGAEGFGKFTKGGRGGKVIEVTNLNDSGPGSLRAAIESTGPRTVVFKVSGTITLKSGITIKNPYLTIAGQTAPGDGICLRGYTFSIDADQVIIRYLRFRLGDESGVEADAIGSRYRKNIVIDHCSASWSVDETFSFYWCDSLTVQWCLISESLYNSNHEKGAHGYGGIWGGKNSSYHHNLLANHSSRNPRFASGSGNTDFRNNVIYNWGFNSSYGGELHDPNYTASPATSINMVANYYKAGPATKSGVLYRIINPSTRSGLADYGKWHVTENFVFGYPNVTSDNWTLGVQGPSASDKTQIKSNTPFSFVAINQQTAEEAYQSVLNEAGAILPRRDVVDVRIINDVKNGSATFEGTTYRITHGFPASLPKTGIIDSQTDVGGWPQLNLGPIPVDTDKDGIPDVWEKANGLKENDATDGNIFGADGYTNLEKYLNSISTFPNFIPAPTNLNYEFINTTSIKLNWADNSNDEMGFIVERAVGTSSFLEIANLNPNAVSFTDNNLAELTTYKYRVRAYNNTLGVSEYTNTVEATTLSATSAPLAASNPNPKNGELNVIRNVILNWSAGLNTESHDVYFGTTNPPSFIGNQKSTFIKNTNIKAGIKYYWRVDEVNKNGKTTGTVWSFTAKAVLPSQKIAHWKFDEGVGVTLKDAGSFANNGSMINMNSASWISDVSNTALNFDGVDDYITVPNNGTIDFGRESFSISLWFKIGASFPTTSMYLISKGSFVRDTTQAKSGKWYGIELKSNQLRFAIDDDVTKSTATVSNIDGVLKNNWNNIIAVRDSSAAQLKIYLNGTQVATVQDQTGDISEQEDLIIGNTVDKTATLLGLLDDVRLYNYALSTSEAQSIYKEIITSVEESEHLPLQFSLDQNYPNPFNPSTVIRYAIPVESGHSAKGGSTVQHVSIKVYDILGREVAALVNEYQKPGKYSVEFRTKSEEYSSGIYFYRLIANGFSQTKKMLMIR